MIDNKQYLSYPDFNSWLVRLSGILHLCKCLCICLCLYLSMLSLYVCICQSEMLQMRNHAVLSCADLSESLLLTGLEADYI